MRVLSILLIFVLFCQCSFQKRLYRKGFYIETNHKINTKQINLNGSEKTSLPASKVCEKISVQKSPDLVLLKPDTVSGKSSMVVNKNNVHLYKKSPLSQFQYPLPYLKKTNLSGGESNENDRLKTRIRNNKIHLLINVCFLIIMIVLYLLQYYFFFYTHSLNTDLSGNNSLFVQLVWFATFSLVAASMFQIIVLVISILYMLARQVFSKKYRDDFKIIKYKLIDILLLILIYIFYGLFMAI